MSDHDCVFPWNFSTSRWVNSQVLCTICSSPLSFEVQTAIIEGDHTPVQNADGDWEALIQAQ